MLRRYAKSGVLVVAFVVLAVEGYLLYGYYDRYYDRGAPSGIPTSNFAGPGEATRRYAGSPNISESTRPGGTRGSENDASAEKSAFTHTATGDNSRGDYTYLSDPGIDGDPNAIFLVTPSEERGNVGSGAYDHNVGVWYEPQKQQWAIFNQDLAPVPSGSTFQVTFPRESGGFVHRSEPPNTDDNSTYLDHPLTNGEPDALVSVTQNWNPGGGGGIYNDHPVDVFYDADVQKWAIYNKDGARMPDRAAFNVAVSGPESTE